MRETPVQSIRWSQVFSLLGLNAAVVISWIAYHHYQPRILELFSVQHLSRFLVIAQAVILVGIPPVAGLIGDYFIKKNGNRFVVWTVGISVTAMVFMLVAFTVGTQSLQLTSILPVMIVIWLISMNVFHSPANSMIELFAPARQLPVAMALMVLTTELLNASEPLLIELVDAVGPVSTFTAGGLLLIVTGYFFRSTTRHSEFSREEDMIKVEESQFGHVLAAGLTLGVLTMFINNFVPAWYRQTDNPLFSDSYLISGILLVSAVAAWPLSRLVDRYGIGRSLVYGAVGCTLGLAGIYFIGGVIPFVCFALVTGLSYSLASVAAFPYALQHLCRNHTTLGAGMFFGSIQLAEEIVNVMGIW
ncbi:MAG: MFS transporter [Cyclobacteriaceae bacterium]|nr:MFS transporter [Cyclobacteriaceae bacterium]